MNRNAPGTALNFARRASSCGTPARTALQRRWSVEYGARDLRGQSGRFAFHLRSSSSKLRRDSLLGRVHVFLRARAHGFQELGSIVVRCLPRQFLLGIDFRARLAQRIMVGIQLLPGAGFGGRSLRARAFNAGAALRHGFLNRPEECPAQEKIEKQNDNDSRQSTEEQFAELVCDFHGKGKVLRPISWLLFAISGVQSAAAAHASTDEQRREIIASALPRVKSFGALGERSFCGLRRRYTTRRMQIGQTKSHEAIAGGSDHVLFAIHFICDEIRFGIGSADRKFP